jgi:hypothetical protein
MVSPTPFGYAKPRAAYQDFLTFWKNADPDIPILTLPRRSTRS